MTTEQPTRPARPPRPGPAFRRAALGLTGPVPEPGSVATAPARRETLREALARIPDLERDAPESPGEPPAPPSAPDEAPVVDPAPAGLRSFASRLLNGSVPEGAEIEPAPVTDTPDPDVPDPEVPDPAPPVVAALGPDAPEWLAEAAARQPEPTARRTARHRRPAVPTWRRVAFGVSVVALITAIPLLGRTGYRLVTESTDGRFSSSVRSPTDPGYEEEVVSTPTLLVMQKDAEGRPVATTVLSLSGANGGGAVIFVPLEAEVRTPAFGVDRISRAFDVLEERPPDGRKQVAVQVASLLNVGLDAVVEVDDRGWAQLVEPVAPLAIVNPDPIEVDGVEIPSGEIELEADEVGPYLAASRPGETAFNALIRHELVWTAWLDAVASSTRDDVVPGETGSGIGLFARGLAAGPVTYSVVPTTPDPDDETLLRVNHNQLDPMVLAAVPNPDPATPGSRPRVRLLNGVSADAIPPELVQKVIQIGGSLAVIGNGPSFGREETTIVYANPINRGYAELLQVALGGGTIRLDPEAEDSVSLTVILGRDVIDSASATTTTIDLGTSPGGS